MKIINVVAAIIKKDNKVFIAERGYGEFKGKWEFPGGKIEPKDIVDAEFMEADKVVLDELRKLDH